MAYQTSTEFSKNLNENENEAVIKLSLQTIGNEPTHESSESSETVGQTQPDTLNKEYGSTLVPREELVSTAINPDQPLNEQHLDEILSNASDDIPSAIAEVAAREIEKFVMITGQSLALSNPKPVMSSMLSTSGLGLLASQYDSSESEDSDSLQSSSSIEETASVESVREPTQLQSQTQAPIEGTYRNAVIDINSDTDSDTDSQSSDVEFIKESTELERMIEGEAIEDDDYTGIKHKDPMRVKGELSIEDLPPIHELYITVPETECAELGKVHSIVEQLLLVDSIPGTAALDLDTVLFLNKGQKVLGVVFDVLGQVSSPLYCVRFNSNKEIIEKGIEVGQPVYIAPRTEHTHFIILKDMLQLRGSDASWEHDIEPSERHLDYSDDEEERSARRSRKNRDRDEEEIDTSKRDRPSPSPLPQRREPVPQRRETFNPRHHHPRNQNPRPQRFRNNNPGEFCNNNFQRPNYQRPQAPMSQYTPRFSYGPVNASWHANFSQPPPTYPFAYTAAMPPTMPFMPPPEAMQQPLFPPPPPEVMQQPLFPTPPQAMQQQFYPRPPPHPQ